MWGQIAGAVIGGIAGSAGKASNASAAATNATKLQAQIAKDQWDRYQSVYAPLETKVATEVQTSLGADDRVAGEAAASVNSEYGIARQRLTQPPGFDPSSAAAQAANSRLGLDQAIAGTDAQTQAKERARLIAWKRKIDALSLGKGLPAIAVSTLASSGNGSLGLMILRAAPTLDTASTAGGIVNDVANQPAVNNWFTGASSQGRNWL